MSIIKSGWELRDTYNTCTYDAFFFFFEVWETTSNWLERQENSHIILKQPPQPPLSINFGVNAPRQASMKKFTKDLKEWQQRHLQMSVEAKDSRAGNIQVHRQGGLPLMLRFIYQVVLNLLHHNTTDDVVDTVLCIPSHELMTTVS